MRLDLYQYDGVDGFRMRLAGALESTSVEELEHAWTCVRSILKGRELSLDIGGLTAFDEAGLTLLARMRECGAKLTACDVPSAPSLVLRLGMAVEPGRRAAARGPLQFFARLSALRLNGRPRSSVFPI